MIDTVDGLLKTTLDALCPNVARLFFRGKAGTYITYQLVSSEDMAAADDGADEVVKEFVSGELTLNVNDLMPADLAAILGQTQDDDQVVYAGENDDPPYMAIGFRAKKANGMYKYIWLYKVKFAIPSENYQTKGDSIEFTTPEITGQFIKRPDGLWKAEHVALPSESAAQSWFTAVREPNNASSEG